MNTKKGKGKNRPNKLPNPSPVLDVLKTPESVDELFAENIESEFKVEDRVPEIVSEVVAPAEVEVKNVEEPKKPKRNRGKKKKNDKDEVEESGDDKPVKNVTEEIKVASTTVGGCNIEIIEEKSAEIPNVAPTARKKKNKNKNATTEQASKGQDNIPKKEESKEVLPIEVAVSNLEANRDILPKPVEEIKPAKKKNKKKKRHDSEKSEKGEEISCTAAFQQLLGLDDKKERKETVSEIKTAVIPEVIPEVKTIISEQSTADENVSKGNKNKKKGKKDKQNAPKTDTEEEIQQPVESVSVAMIEEKDTLMSDIRYSKSENTPKNIVTDKLEENIMIPITTSEQAKPAIEDDVKSKAKIAKPVDKKRKEKSNRAIKECESENIDIPDSLKLENMTLATAACEIKDTEVEQVKSVEISIEKTIQPEEHTLISLPELITLPQSPMGKKRKKSPKPLKQRDTYIETEQLEIKEIKEEAGVESEKVLMEMAATDRVQEKVFEETLKRKKSPKPPKQLDTHKETEQLEIKDIKEEAGVESEKILMEMAATERVKEKVFEETPKRKKSPKPPKQLDIHKETEQLEIKDIKEEAGVESEKILMEMAATKRVKEKVFEETPKRKKSPKPPKQRDTHKETEQLEIKNIKEAAGVESEKILIEMAATERVKETVFEEMLKHKILETPKELMCTPEFNKEPEIESTEEHKSAESTLNINLNVKPDKKRKKSPKPMTKLEITKENEPVKKETESIIQTEIPVDEMKMPEKPVEPSKRVASEERKSDVFYDMPEMQDIEISSVKGGDSEGSIQEIVPDVQYPRAASQQRVDDNNNTVIREMVTLSDVKLGIPDTPLNQEGDIPPTSPELIPSGIGVLDDDANVVKPSEEKTDIKSKMMEVNQDMEELRLSIERSLAELTSMEKSEETVNKKYDDQLKNKAMEENPQPVSSPVLKESNKAIGEESQITESEILKVEKKPMEAIMPAPVLLPHGNKEGKSSLPAIPLPPPLPKEEQPKPTREEIKPTETTTLADAPPVCPARKDNKGKGKSKKKGKQETGHASTATEAASSSSEFQATQQYTQDTKTEEKKEQQSGKSQEKTKKQCDFTDDNNSSDKNIQEESSCTIPNDFEPIESFEDAMTSSVDDVNKSYEMIISESAGSHVNPEINIIAPTEETKSDMKDEKQSPVTPPKNLLGHPVIPARSNRMDYKKEKNKTPNTILAKVKIKDSIEIESKKQSKESQTENIKKLTQKKSIIDESISTLNENEEFVYKYSFRKVFLPSVCHVCKKELKPMRVSCSYCHLLFYCSQKHKDEDWPQHQAFCFAISTIAHLKNQKHIYEDAAGITGHNYRLLRMQMIVSCEKILKRKLLPSEQEVLLYPRLCGDWRCREYRLNKLADCNGCGQIAYCSSDPDHLPKSHQRWCKSYSLYQKLVCYQQTRGRLEPKLPSRVMTGPYQVPDKINEVLAAMYEEKIDMNDVEYAALTQLATAPLTAVYSFQIYTNKMNSIYANGTYKKTSFAVHVVGAELQFEADALNKWELFFLHLRPDIMELMISLIAPDLNPSNLPLDLLGKVKLCDQCRQDKRRLLFSFQDKKTYSEYYRSDDFTTPDIVCAFNPSIQRSSIYNGKDPWPATVSCILKQKVPFIITSYTIEELRRDLARVKECSDFNVVSEPKYNPFASVRPDRNFITDDEIPLLFKNYCFAVVSGVF